MCFLDNTKDKNQRSFESKELYNHSLTFSSLGNLLLWVRVYINESSLTMLDFID